MACPTGQIIAACDFPQYWVDQTPHFDQMIMEDIRPTDGWLYNVSTGTMPTGMGVSIYQDRFRWVQPNVTKTWNRVSAATAGCTSHPCDPTENRIGFGADRLEFYPEEQVWATDLFCYNQAMLVSQAEAHMRQIISKILKPATTWISSTFLRKRCLQWANRNLQCNSAMSPFTYTWTLGGAGADEELYFDCSCAPTNTYKLVPQALQSLYSPLLRDGYAGENPFRSEVGDMIELVTSMDTLWSLDKLGGQQGVGAASNPSVAGNWRFTDWGDAHKYWRYGFSGQIGNFLARVDELGLRFNYVGDLGAGSAPNRYRYQVVLPYTNNATTGAGGAAGIGADVNSDFDKTHFELSFISHKMGMQLLTQEATPLNPQMPFGFRDFGGQWQWQMHDLGADSSGTVINNAWQNKGRFGAWFRYWIRPLHTEFMVAFFHKREPMCIPQIDTCSDDPGYPTQNYESSNDGCD